LRNQGIKGVRFTVEQHARRVQRLDDLLRHGPEASRRREFDDAARLLESQGRFRGPALRVW
jgi:hypothetical protein